MRRPIEPLFLARESYRRRRLGDAAKLVPIVGLILFLLPLLWAAAARTGSGIVYIFVIWAALIILIGFISKRLILAEKEAEAEQVGDLDREL